MIILHHMGSALRSGVSVTRRVTCSLKSRVCSAPLIPSIGILSQNQSDFTPSGYQRSMRLTLQRLAVQNFIQRRRVLARIPNYLLPFVRPLAATTCSSSSRCLKVYNGSRSCLGSDPGQTNWKCSAGGLRKRVISPTGWPLALLWSPSESGGQSRPCHLIEFRTGREMLILICSVEVSKWSRASSCHWKLSQKSIAPKSHLWQDGFVVASE